MTQRLGSWLVVLGVGLAGLGGGFLPWIWRDPVALQLTAPGLAEFVKFLPEVRLGQVQLQRLFFLPPLFLAMLALPLLAANRQLLLPTWLRWLVRLAIVPLALAALSPVWTPTILLAPEFRLQTGLALLALGLALTAPWFKHLPLTGLISLLLGGSLAALILPWWQFRLIQPAIAEAYHQPLWLGWGWGLTATGIMVSLAGGMWLLFFQRKSV